MVMLTVYKSLVRSHLEYCCPMWHPHKIEDIQRLEQIQRVFTSKITGMSSLSYWERIRSLGIMSLQRRRERYIIIHMWKLLHEIVPNDVNVKFRPLSRLGVKAELPTINRSSRVSNQTLFEKSFAVVGPQLWNWLPSQLSSIENENTFKCKLTEFMKGLCDEPPVRRYVRRHGNTLPEVRRISGSLLER